jgi:hypothetical protein
MSTGRNNTPSWVPQIVSALITVGAVWGTIQKDVPKIVREEVRAELDAQRIAMVHRQDSLWANMRDTLMARTDHLAAASVDSMAKAVGLMVMDRSRITYSPQITVQADTAMAQQLEAKLDTMLVQMLRLRGQIAQANARPTKKTAAGPWNYE